ncbi:hypothetical protein MY1884_009254 [Beauveria asiatica]
MACLATYLVGAASLCLAAAQNSTTPPSNGPRNLMLQLSTDESFHFEILRTLSLSVAEGAGLGEVLVAAQQIRGSVGAAVYQNQVLYDWFEDVFTGAR